MVRTWTEREYLPLCQIGESADRIGPVLRRRQRPDRAPATNRKRVSHRYPPTGFRSGSQLPAAHRSPQARPRDRGYLFTPFGDAKLAPRGTGVHRPPDTVYRRNASLQHQASHPHGPLKNPCRNFEWTEMPLTRALQTRTTEAVVARLRDAFPMSQSPFCVALEAPVYGLFDALAELG